MMPSRSWGTELDALMSNSSSALGQENGPRADVLIVLDSSYSMRGRLQRGKAILRCRALCTFGLRRTRHDSPIAGTSDRFSSGTNASRSSSVAA